MENLRFENCSECDVFTRPCCGSQNKGHLPGSHLKVSYKMVFNFCTSDKLPEPMVVGESPRIPWL